MEAAGMTRDRTVTILSLILPVCLSSSPHFRSKFFRVESNKLVHAEEASHERLPGPSRSQEHGQFRKEGCESWEPKRGESFEWMQKGGTGYIRMSSLSLKKPEFVGRRQWKEHRLWEPYRPGMGSLGNCVIMGKLLSLSFNSLVCKMGTIILPKVVVNLSDLIEVKCPASPA